MKRTSGYGIGSFKEERRKEVPPKWKNQIATCVTQVLQEYRTGGVSKESYMALRELYAELRAQNNVSGEVKNAVASVLEMYKVGDKKHDKKGNF